MMSAGGATAEAMIRLRGLSKTFPGQRQAAVEHLDLDVAAGEIVVLVGPSGCGKTTSLRLINRLIEPSGGTIELDGEDVTDVHPDRLRRRIGYVIQQVGLFPHQTIAQNVATVPQMLGWDSQRITARVDELLETVGMDPGTYRDRYPRELSGGQSQRVGVARAMAADPPVLLMDEPFGAIDPITRERLQDEFLRLQGEVRKTIVFVTHDIDEAVKIGDRICLLQEGARIAQHDTPERLLTAPANEFVADFIGSGALVRGLRLATVDEVELPPYPSLLAGEAGGGALRSLHEEGREHAVLLDAERRPRRWVDASELGDGAPNVESGVPITSRLNLRSTLHDALNEMLGSGNGLAAVVDEDGLYQGVIDLETLARAVDSMRSTSAGPDQSNGRGNGTAG
ncbi:betaine/proline/choline family ABC transporter ATP-binding protein [soil metagenome]